ncbi:MAG: Uma2 family endonuclease [Streptosporangiaceae bacterium]
MYLNRDGGFDVEDVDALPDDGRRHELVDGVIVLSPPPRRIHQRALTTLTTTRFNTLPGHLEVLVAPFDVDAGPNSQVEPDVLVLPRDDSDPPLLAVEVLSPSNRGYDPVTKRNLYERIRVPSYWIVDPDEPAATVVELNDAGRYVEVARASGGASVSGEQPYPVTFRPVDLVA